MYKAIYTYPWDLADEGLETVLGRVRPLGINTITLAASYHAGKFVRPHGRSGKVYFPKDGTVYFKARPERYGHIRPLVNPLVEDFDGFAELQKQAPGPGALRLGRLPAQHAARHAASRARQPQRVRRSLSLQPVPGASGGARLRGQSVRRPGRSLRHRPASCSRRRAGCRTTTATTTSSPCCRWTATPRRCWPCASPMRRYAPPRPPDVDAERLQAKVRALLERWFAADLAVPEAMAAAWWETEIVADPEWAKFLHWRCRAGRRPGGRDQGRAAGGHQARRDPDRAAAERLLLARGQRSRHAGGRRRRARGAGLPAERRGGVLDAWHVRAPGRRRRAAALHPAAELSRPRRWWRDGRRGAPAEGGRAWPASPSTTTATSALPASRTSRARSRCSTSRTRRHDALRRQGRADHGWRPRHRSRDRPRASLPRVPRSRFSIATVRPPRKRRRRCSGREPARSRSRPTSRTRPASPPPSRRPWRPSRASTCWSTTRRGRSAAISRRPGPRTGEASSKAR